MSEELDADARLVAFMQYLRVLVVVVIAPVVAGIVLTDFSAPAPDVHQRSSGLVADIAFTLGCGGAGLLLARVRRITAGALLLPLIVASVASASGLSGGAAVPDPLQQLAFAALGLQVGLRFTAATIRQAGRLLPAVLLAVMVVACAGLGGLLVLLTDVRFMDAYLATTPGGLYVIAAIAIGEGGDAGFVLAAQSVRLFVVMLAAPPLVRLLLRAGSAGP